MPPSLLYSRDLGTDAENVRNTFSSWDSCMAQSYCKYPAIIAIVVGSLIVISILWCCCRCLFCGLDCCCGCFSCCNRCCPSGRRKNDGYQQTGPVQQPYAPYGYQPQASPMMYGAGGVNGYAYRGPQTATFDTSSKKTGAYNEDSLPAMPSWQDAQSRHVQDEDVEMEKLDQNAAQQQSLLNGQRESDSRYYNNGPHETAGDLGTMQAGPYHDYNSHQQYAPSTTETALGSIYPPTYHTRPESSVYGEQQYAPSVAPSYRTNAPSVMSPVQQHTAMPMPVGRKPVAGSWRDV